MKLSKSTIKFFKKRFKNLFCETYKLLEKKGASESELYFHHHNCPHCNGIRDFNNGGKK